MLWGIILPLILGAAGVLFFIYTTVRHGFKVLAFIALLNVLLFFIHFIILAAEGYAGGHSGMSRLAESMLLLAILLTVVSVILSFTSSGGKYALVIALIPLLVFSVLLAKEFAPILENRLLIAEQKRSSLQSDSDLIDALTREFTPTQKFSAYESFLTLNKEKNLLIIIYYEEIDGLRTFPTDPEMLGSIEGNNLTLISETYRPGRAYHENLLSYKNSSGQTVFEVYTVSFKRNDGVAENTSISKDLLY